MALMPHSTEPPVSQNARDANSRRQTAPRSQGSSPRAMGRSRRSMMVGISAWSPIGVAQPGQPGVGLDQDERERALAPPFARVALRPLQPPRELHGSHLSDPHGKNLVVSLVVKSFGRSPSLRSQAGSGLHDQNRDDPLHGSSLARKCDQAWFKRGRHRVTRTVGRLS